MILRSHSFQNTFLYGSIFRYQVRNKVAKILVNILYVDFNPCQEELRDISIQTAKYSRGLIFSIEKTIRNNENYFQPSMTESCIIKIVVCCMCTHFSGTYNMLPAINRHICSIN